MDGLNREKVKITSPYKNVLLYFAFLAVLILAVEILARRFVHQNFSKMGHQYIMDDDLLYRHRPGFHGQWETQSFTEEVSLNQLGTRGDEVDPEVPTVLVMGDSMVFGHGVQNRQTFSSLLEDKLENYQFINAGVKGYGSDQNVILLQKLLKKISPQKVVFSINENDLVDNHVKERYELVRNSLERTNDQESLFPKYFKLYYQYIYSWFPSRALQYVHTKTLRFAMNWDIRKNFDLSYQKRKIVKQLEHLSQLAAQENFELYILAVPVENRGTEVYDWLEPVDGARLLVPEMFSAEDYISNDIHFNSKGHQKMANYLKGKVFEAY